MAKGVGFIVRLTCTLVGIGWLPAGVVLASPAGEMLAAQVQESTYAYYMEDLLFTYLGDDRGFGPEHDPARTNIFRELQGFGLDVALDPFIYNSVTYNNVIATLPGTTFPNEYYIVCAHFDSVNNPGADDNATGTAAVMEVARVLASTQPEYTIKFILWDREEQGLRGSSAYAAAHVADTIHGVLNFDMIGHQNHTSGSYEIEIYGRTASAPIMNDFADAVSTYCTQLTSSFIFTTSALSDHAPFAAQGRQACSSIEWNYILNTRYHTQQDAIDIEPGYIDYTMTTQVCQAAVGFLADHANITIMTTPGDADGDGDVDLDDYKFFGNCMAGPVQTTPPAGCGANDFETLDLDENGTVDLVDFEIMSLNFTG